MLKTLNYKQQTIKKKKQKRKQTRKQNGWKKDISQSGYYGQEEQYPNWVGWMCELW
jgi:hypothetical protein